MMFENIDNFYRRLGRPSGLSHGSGTCSGLKACVLFLFPFYGHMETHFAPNYSAR